MRRAQCVLVSLTAAAAAALPVRGQQMTGAASRGFELSAGQSIDAEGNALLVLSTSISHRRLVFFRTPAGFEARYRIFIDLRGGDGRRVSGEVEEETVAVVEYEMTRSPRLVSNLRSTIPVDPGNYTAKVAIEVIGTSLRYEREVKVQVFGREEGVFEITQPAFSIPGPLRREGRPPEGETVFSLCQGVVPDGFAALAGGAFADPGGWLRIGLAILTPAAERTSSLVELSLKVSSGDRQMVRYLRRMVDTGAEGRAIVCLDMNVDDLAMGRYEVQAAAGIPHSTRKAVTSGSFAVLLSRATFGSRFEETLDLLSYIAEDRELQPLRDAPPDRRLEEWDGFWRRRDPAPAEAFNEGYEEFLDRLASALERFGGSGPGWKTDRGRIYIRYGPPDEEIDRDGTTLGARLKIWYYYSRGIAFIFEDPMGTGRYTLMTTRSI
ncbi:MAG: GWxTD domain-containing protein [Candidatus Krumholzibacteria bacterium]|nr:GWxTD domain-containing protein [Candidatus Krumholzibacteria bacterium]